MIYDTDVKSAALDYNASGTQFTTYPIRLKGILIYPTYLVVGGIALFDGTSDSDPLKLKVGVQIYTGYYFGTPMIKIPGNGILFKESLYVTFPNDFTAGTDTINAVTFFWQK